MATIETDSDEKLMTLALEEARKCEPKLTAFSVGCVLVARPANSPPVILATGYSRELEGNTHAEANALAKAKEIPAEKLRALFPEPIPSTVLDALCIDDVLRVTDVYTTMEPCSVRTSGLAPCATALINAGIRRCIIGTSEPDDFVHCVGAKQLTDAGVEIVWLKGLEEECLKVARMNQR